MNYLHIGFEKSVKESSIVGIFDIDTTTVSASSRSFLSRAEKEGRLEDAEGNLPKSYIITELMGKKKVFLSPLATATLKQRACPHKRKEEAYV